MATSGNQSSQMLDWRARYVAALMEADKEIVHARIAEAEHAIVGRAREFNASGDNTQEQEALDDALYALRALKSCLEIHGEFAVAA